MIRANIIITDEYVLVKKKDYTEIVRPTLEPRRFKCRPNFPDYDEETKEILLSSAKTKTNWGWRYLKDIVQRHFKGENVGFYAGDIYTAVANGIKTKKQFEKDKKSTDDISFMQEYLNIWLGNSEKSLYKYEDFEANQILQNAFIPLSDYDFMMGEENEYRPKDNEVRILAMDVAIATGQSNDNTAIILGNINRDTLLASVEYVNGINGLGTDEQCLLVKRLFYEYNAHYFVFDSKGLGNSFYSALNKETFDPQRNVTYPAWRIHEDSMLMMCTQSALNEKMAMATNDGEDVIIPVVGSASLNTLMHLALRKSLKDSVIKFLIDDGEASAYFEEQKYKDKWMLMTADERSDKMLPYLNTKFMINEAVSLEADMKDDGNIKVIETRTGYKDRFMALDYFNYFTTLLRTKWFNETDNDEIDVSEWELVF